MFVKIELLADHMHLAQMIAQWHFDEWSHGHPGATLEEWTAGLRCRNRRDGIPSTFIAFHGEEPVGSAVLVTHDLDSRRDLSPWLAGVFVAPHRRGKGIGTALVEHAMSEARRFGVGTLYMYTRGGERFYERMGWKVVGTEALHGRSVTVMSVELDA